MKSRLNMICLLWIPILLFGCLPQAYPTSPSLQTATPQTLETASLLPTIDLPTATNTPFINVVASTLPAIPTLEDREAISLLQRFLMNDPPCQLPCWGNITPGNSTVSDAQRLLVTLKGISDSAFFGQVKDTWTVGTLNIYYSLENTVVNIHPGYTAMANDGIVLHIGVGTQSLPPANSTGLVFGDKEYNALLSDYTLPEIFTTYGLPNLIYTRADINMGEPTARDFFIIRLLYLDLGIFISYTMPMEEKGDVFSFCPSKSLIMLDLTPQDIGETYDVFFQQVGITEWATLDKAHYQPLEDALGMTNQEFSQVIISAPETCFESPIEIWPRP